MSRREKKLINSLTCVHYTKTPLSSNDIHIYRRCGHIERSLSRCCYRKNLQRLLVSSAFCPRLPFEGRLGTPRLLTYLLLGLTILNYNQLGLADLVNWVNLILFQCLLLKGVSGILTQPVTTRNVGGSDNRRTNRRSAKIDSSTLKKIILIFYLLRRWVLPPINYSQLKHSLVEIHSLHSL